MDKVPLEYQKSIIWHEFVHLYDTFNIELEGNQLIIMDITQHKHSTLEKSWEEIAFDLTEYSSKNQ